MNKNLLLLVFSLLAACTLRLTTPTPFPFSTPLPLTDTPTATVTPTRTPTFTPTPVPPSILNADNISRLAAWTRIYNDFTRSLAFSPDSLHLAAASGNKGDGNFNISVWRLMDGGLAMNVAGFTGTVWDLAFSPDGQWIASVADNSLQQRALIHDAHNGSLIKELTGPGGAYCLAFSPDNHLLVIGGDLNYSSGMIWVYETTTWSLLREMKVPNQNVLDLAFVKDGSEFFSSGTDGIIRRWRASNGQSLGTMYKNRQANRIALSPDGKLLASIYCRKTDPFGCISGGSVVWGLHNRSQLMEFPDLAEAVAFSTDGTLLAIGSGANDPYIRIRETNTWATLWEANLEGANLAFSPDGKMLASSDWKTITIWAVR